MSSRLLKRLLVTAGVMACAAVPAPALAQDDPSSGQYTENAPDFEPGAGEQQEPEETPAPTPAPAPSQSQSQGGVAPSQSTTPETTAPSGEQLPVTGANPWIAVAAAMLLLVGVGLRRTSRAS